jgi:hypothetical protein
MARPHPGRAMSGEWSAQPVELDLTLPEVKELWSFLDGLIMSADARHQLWRSWGPCSRHTWASAVAECVYRVSLHSTAILYEDLMGRAVAVLRRPALSDHARLRRLEARGPCITCDYLEIARDGDPSFRDRQERVNRRELFTRLLGDARPVWESRTCPLCLGGDGVVCRPHLLAGAAEITPELSSRLDELHGRLTVFAKSMRWQGPTSTPDERASWVEALGWFAGWQYPAAALAAATTAVGSRSRGRS